jgi:alkylation response protein AidB-like acyl-CoA dehydrogenase
MAQQIAERRDVDFVLYEQLGLEEMIKNKRYGGINKKTVDMIITEARNFAIKEILPIGEEGDKIGLKFENNQVIVPECFHKPYEKLKEGEWLSMIEDPEIGGQGLPLLVAQAATEYIIGADFSFGAFGYASHGAAKMIEIFGTEEQKNCI